MDIDLGDDCAYWFAVLFCNEAKMRPVEEEVAVSENGVWLTEFVVYEFHYD